jgi:hypothetical protein
MRSQYCGGVKLLKGRRDSTPAALHNPYWSGAVRTMRCIEMDMEPAGCAMYRTVPYSTGQDRTGQDRTGVCTTVPESNGATHTYTSYHTTLSVHRFDSMRPEHNNHIPSSVLRWWLLVKLKAGGAARFRPFVQLWGYGWSLVPPCFGRRLSSALSFIAGCTSVGGSALTTVSRIPMICNPTGPWHLS